MDAGAYLYEILCVQAAQRLGGAGKEQMVRFIVAGFPDVGGCDGG